MFSQAWEIMLAMPLWVTSLAKSRERELGMKESYYDSEDNLMNLMHEDT
jgi:hypothetical protein